jgi:hypothetical protein
MPREITKGKNSTEFQLAIAGLFIGMAVMAVGALGRALHVYIGLALVFSGCAIIIVSLVTYTRNRSRVKAQAAAPSPILPSGRV